MKYLSIGVISEGTLKPEDIIPCMLSALKEVDDPKAKEIFERFNNDFVATPEEHLSEMLAELEEEMMEFTPPYSFLGTTDGDGACFGVWPDIEAVQQDMRDGELQDFQKTEDDFVGTVVDISDHGNVSLISFNKGETTEIWSVV